MILFVILPACIAGAIAHGRNRDIWWCFMGLFFSWLGVLMLGFGLRRYDPVAKKLV